MPNDGLHLCWLSVHAIVLLPASGKFAWFANSLTGASHIALMVLLFVLQGCRWRAAARLSGHFKIHSMQRTLGSADSKS